MTQAPARPSSWSQFCRWLGSSGAFAPFRQRRNRRIVVAMYLVVMAAFPVLGWLTDSDLPTMLLLIPYVAGLLLMTAGTQALLDRPTHKLDERELHIRRTVLPQPYMTGATLGFAGGALVTWASGANDALFLGVFLAAWGLVFSVEALVLAWRLPDLVNDEE